jgi:hypothetical protein
VRAFGEHPAGGTSASIESIKQSDLRSFYDKEFLPNKSVLIMTGDISPSNAASIAERFLGTWKGSADRQNDRWGDPQSPGEGKVVVARILVVDLPGSGPVVGQLLQTDPNHRTRKQRLLCSVGFKLAPWRWLLVPAKSGDSDKARIKLRSRQRVRMAQLGDKLHDQNANQESVRGRSC